MLDAKTDVGSPGKKLKNVHVPAANQPRAKSQVVPQFTTMEFSLMSDDEEE
jgi:hypothetical protein